jgi:hypothetical protein
MSDHGDAIQNRGPVVLAVTTAMLVASSIFVILRLVSRAGIVRRILWDDYFIILAWVCACIPCGCDYPVVADRPQLIGFVFSFSICWGTSGIGTSRSRCEAGVAVVAQEV